MKLYEIEKALREIDEDPSLVDLYTGALTDDGLKKLDELTLAKRVKVCAIGKLVLEKKALVAGIKSEVERLTKYAKTVENGAASLGAYLASFMEEGEKFADDSVRVSTVKNPEAVVASLQVEDAIETQDLDIFDDEFVERFVRVQTTYSLNKKELGDVLKEAAKSETQNVGTAWGDTLAIMGIRLERKAPGYRISIR